MRPAPAWNQDRAARSPGDPLQGSPSEVRRVYNQDLAPDPTRRYFDWSRAKRYHHPTVQDVRKDQIKLGNWKSRVRRSGDPSPNYRGSRVTARHSYRRPPAESEVSRRRETEWQPGLRIATRPVAVTTSRCSRQVEPKSYSSTAETQRRVSIVTTTLSPPEPVRRPPSPRAGTLASFTRDLTPERPPTPGRDLEDLFAAVNAARKETVEEQASNVEVSKKGKALKKKAPPLVARIRPLIPLVELEEEESRRQPLPRPSSSSYRRTNGLLVLDDTVQEQLRVEYPYHDDPVTSRSYLTTPVHQVEFLE